MENPQGPHMKAVVLQNLIDDLFLGNVQKCELCLRQPSSAVLWKTRHPEFSLKTTLP